MVKCPKCGNKTWSDISCDTITEDYLKAMKEDLPSYQYGTEHPDWGNIARVGIGGTIVSIKAAKKIPS